MDRFTDGPASVSSSPVEAKYIVCDGRPDGHIDGHCETSELVAGFSIGSRYQDLDLLMVSQEAQVSVAVSRGKAMTQAVCFACGEIKIGAFNFCRACQQRPMTDEQLMLSLP